MKFFALFLVLSSASLFAESAHIRVSPFQAQLELRNENVRVQSAELILSTNFCFIASSCQAGSEKNKVTTLKIDQNDQNLKISLLKKAELKIWRPIPYKLQSCSFLILLRGQDSRGKKLLGRLDAGSLGGTPEECSDPSRADNFLTDYLARSPEITWLNSK